MSSRGFPRFLGTLPPTPGTGRVVIPDLRAKELGRGQRACRPPQPSAQAPHIPHLPPFLRQHHLASSWIQPVGGASRRWEGEQVRSRGLSPFSAVCEGSGEGSCAAASPQECGFLLISACLSSPICLLTLPHLLTAPGLAFRLCFLVHKVYNAVQGHREERVRKEF